MTQSDSVPIERLLEHRAWVEALARSLVADENRAADVAQDAWLAALKHPPRHASALRAWLARLVRHRAADLRRGEDRRTRREEASPLAPRGAADPADVVARIEEHERLVRAVLALAEPYHTAVMLRYYDALSAAEIAERTGAPVDTVRTRLKRGLAQLRERLDAEHGGDGRAWSAALLPLAIGGGFGTKSALIQGGLAVTAKTKVALAVAAVLLIALTVSVAVLRSEQETVSSSDGSIAVATGTADAKPHRERSTDAGTSAADALIATPRGTSGVVGAVRFAEGNRAAGGQTVSIATAGAKSMDAVTDDRGVFRFEKLGELRAWRVSVVAVGFAPVVVTDVWLERDETRDLGSLVLAVPSRIDFVVKDWGDKPIAGATVEVFTRPDLTSSDQWTNLALLRDVPEPAVTATTDGSGHAAVPAIASGAWNVVARAPAFVPAWQRAATSGRADEKTEMTFRLDRGCRVEGVILTSDRKPARGFVVWAGTTSAFEGAGMLPRATTGADGVFVLDAVRAGDVKLSVGRLGLPPADAGTVRVPSSRAVEIVLDGNLLEGRITSVPEGAPLAGARVRASMNSQPAANWIVEAMTDEDGRYRLDTIRAGTVNTLRVERSGYVPFAQNPFESGGLWFEKGRAVRDFALRRGVGVAGRVTTQAGPTIGARVTVNWGLKSAGLANVATFTDADGRFALTGVPPGEVVIQVRADGATQKGLDNNWVGDLLNNRRPTCATDVPETGLTDVVVELTELTSASRTVSGRVESETGAAVAGATVKAGTASATSAADGSFHLTGVATGARRFVTASNGGATGSQELAAEGDVENVVVRLIEPSHVTGRVTTWNGAAAEYASVELFFVETSGPNRGWRTSKRVPVQDGRFDADFAASAGPSGVAVRASAPGFASVDSPVLATDASRRAHEADLVLGALSAIAGRVVSAAGGSDGVSGARITLMPKGWQPSTNDNTPRAIAAVSETDGRFRVTDIPEGDFTLEVVRDGFVREVVPVRVPVDGLVVTLTPALEISGIVRLPDGSPCAHANVSVRRENDDTPANWYPVQSGSDGRFRLTGLPAGTFTMQVSPAYLSTSSVRRWEKQGIAAGTQDVVIAFETAGEISGRVLDPDGKPLAECSVQSYSETADPYTPSAKSQADGSFVIRGLGAGTFAVIANPPEPRRMNNITFGARFLAARATGLTVGAKDVEIRLSEGATIAGVLVNSTGAPVSSTWVRADLLPGQQIDFWMHSPGSGMLGAQTSTAGVFAITGLMPGRYRVVHVPDPNMFGGGRPVRGGDDVTAGASGLRLVTGGVATISGTVLDESGKPMAKVSVQATPVGGGPELRAITDDAGVFTMKDVSDLVHWTVLARKTFLVPAQADDVAPGASGLVFRLVAGLEASGRVLQKDGTPYAKRSLYLTLEGSDYKVSAQTDADGRFVAKALKEGVYRVEEAIYMQRYGQKLTPRPCGTIKAGERDVELKMTE